MADLHARLAENQRIIEARPLSREDYQNWATRARTEWARANEALRKVLGLHRKVGSMMSPYYVCASCLDGYGESVIYPCPTVKVIDEAMSDDDQ